MERGYLIVLILTVGANVIFFGYKKKLREKLDKKLHPFREVYGLPMLIVDCMPKKLFANEKRKSGKYLEYLYTDNLVEERQYFYIVKKITTSMFIFMLVLIFGTGMSISSEHTGKIKTLHRQLQEEGETEYLLDAITEEGNEKMELIVQAKKLTEEEILQKMEEAYDDVVSEMLLDNDSCSMISSPISFPLTAADGLIDITWEMGEEGIIDYDGKIVCDDIAEEGKELTLRMTMNCEDVTKEYEITLVIFSFLTGENLQERVQQYIDSNNQYDDEIILPDKIGDESIEFSYSKDETGKYILLAAFPLAIFIFYIKDYDLRKDMKKREEQMLEDYPEIVSKITLLNFAGMTVTASWKKIVDDYMAGRNKERRYAYEEMKRTQMKINNGVSPIVAFGEFGKRCRLHSFMKLGGLLQQNLQRGTKGLAAALNNEAEDIFELRKNIAKKKGEEAGTKLLIPMIIMLVVSMVIIIVPAFLSIKM